MKSTVEQLKKRGFATEADVEEFGVRSRAELLLLLQSDIPVERTIAARRFRGSEEPQIIEALGAALIKEKALYTKIELQNTLAKSAGAAIPFLINQLGKIGNNQHRHINNQDIQKKTYPLARDISARILCRIGPETLPALIEILETGSYSQKLEAIDAVGHITYHYHIFDAEVALLKLVHSNECDTLMLWKIIKAMQAFDNKLIRDELLAIIETESEAILITEAKRSLQRIKTRTDTK